MKSSVFNWRGTPSTVGAVLMRGLYRPADATNITYSKRGQTSSIASAEKLKQMPGKGRSATA